MKYRKPPRRTSRYSPDLVLAYLHYALDDVRTFSEPSARHLELAINALTEDTKPIQIPETATSMWPS